MYNNLKSPFHGFDEFSAKKSAVLNSIYKNIIEELADNHLSSSTPQLERNYKSIMEISFTTYCGENIKSTGNCGSSNNALLAIDNDSGYVSHNHESNLEISTENPTKNNANLNGTKPIYISEDALLEKPSNCVRNPPTSPDSTVNSSDISIKTTFSGLENESDESYVSDVSIVIENPKVIIFHIDKNTSTTSNVCSFINPSDNSNINNSMTESPAYPTIISNNNENISETSINICNNKAATKLVLSSVTNTCDNNNLLLVKENEDNNKINQKYDNLSNNMVNICEIIRTPQKLYKNLENPECSPDLFSDYDDGFNREVIISPKKKKQDINITKNDLKLIKNVQSGLTGVFPPPSVTIIQLSVTEMLEKIHNNSNCFWNNTENGDGVKNGTTLLINGTKSETVEKIWPEILCSRYHGLHYNRSKLSEEFEQLCMKYAERYVGAETQSSCTTFAMSFPSPSKRKPINKFRSSNSNNNGKSPSRRLSHLARRRITFSSSNLQAAGSSGLLGSRTRQILVDAKKLGHLSRRKSPRKTPKKTPSKSPLKRLKTTPSSSTKKKLAMRYQKVSGEFNASSCDSQSFKRALFVSPERSSNKSGGIESSSLFPSLSTVASVRKGTKRALFTSPCKKSPLKKSPYKKRKCTETDNVQNSTQFCRSMSLDIRPTSSEIKNVLNRTKSDTGVVNLNSSQSKELSEIHKKKLQWAVYESLRLQNISSTHPQFKVFASVLARVTRRFLPNLSSKAQRPEGSTSERMLRIARHHSYAVVKGKSVDEIINEYMKSRVRPIKPQGYIGIEEFNKMNNKENVLQDKGNIIESISKRQLNLFDDKTKKVIESKIDKIRKVIKFDDNDNSSNKR